MFTAYLLPVGVGDLIESHGCSYHQFADDTQLFITIDSFNMSSALQKLSLLSISIRSSCFDGLQLNADKLEVVFRGTATQLKSAMHPDRFCQRRRQRIIHVARDNVPEVIPAINNFDRRANGKHNIPITNL